MTVSCACSFDDLFLAVNGRVMTAIERQELFALPQNQRNQVVEDWAKQAGWQTEKRTGSDQQQYTAFRP